MIDTLHSPMVIVACGAKKRAQTCRADQMYLGNLHQAALRYARALTSDNLIRILSAKHGLLALDREIAPYDVTLGALCSTGLFDVVCEQFRQWHAEEDLSTRPCVALCGKRYLDMATVPILTVVRRRPQDTTTPLRGLGIGQQVQWLNRQVEI